MTENNMIKAAQEQELDRIRHEIEVTKLKLELERLNKYGLPLNIPDIKQPLWSSMVNRTVLDHKVFFYCSFKGVR